MKKQNTFQHTGHYVCECGKEFTKSQSFNAHKSSCKIHYESIGRLEDFFIKQAKIKETSIKTNETKHTELVVKKKVEQDAFMHNWLSEQHKCERCGKIMTEYFGSGKFCSRSCANARTHTEESKHKISLALIKQYHAEFSDEEAELISKENKLQNTQKQHKVLYKGPKLPTVKHDSRKPGYPNRHKIPYSEQFWKQVLDNNNISYEMNVSIWKPGPNNYYLDFLIDGKVDLEIDGEFHLLPEVMKKDKIRTEWLKSKGYIVYRIKWINPDSEARKIIVNKQITDLFKFLNKPRIK